MMSALSGSLLSNDALARDAGESLGVALDPEGARASRAAVAGRHRRMRPSMGPACGARLVFDRLAAPLFQELGYAIALSPAPAGALLSAVLAAGGREVATLIVTPWGLDPAAAWREAVRHGIAHGLRWSLCVNGPELRVIDAERTYSRRFAQFDLDDTVDTDAGFAPLWGLLRAAAFGYTPPLLERAIAISEQHRATVRASLQSGVEDALGHLVRAFARTRAGSRRRHSLFDESLVVVYRVLFLLFAEARGLVPRWHPVYRDGYTIEALRPLVEGRGEPVGLWESLQAIARLAHGGCRAGTLRVPPFNGRLFSPAHAPLAESVTLDGAAVQQALLALTTRRGRAGRERIAYGDLGVEQLGGVYERVLDFDAVVDRGRVTLRRGGRRKATGSFYTPRSLTEYIVRRTLAPLVRDASPEAVLSLKVLDPAMGSGAFLVAACRYLAVAYERALVESGGFAAGDIGPEERASFRRAVAQRCLFGVDVNPMAVQLGRLSLWLATLAADKPLTFLDHHLRAGNSLVGASLADIARPPAARAVRRDLPLFEMDEAGRALGDTVGPRLAIALGPGDTIEQVRAKEHALARIGAPTAPLARWREVADLWCARWFGLPEAAKAGVFGSLTDRLLGRPATLPDGVAGALLGHARDVAAAERFFHWALEFPEVFHAPDGTPLPSGGFDAILGNPPWEMLRADGADPGGRGAAGPSRLTAFARGSGTYPLQGGGHANLYQLFFERALSLLRRDGRLGMILPSGLASDHGCAGLRRAVLDTTRVDTFTCVENRDGLFPIHRSLRFLCLTLSAGGRTTALPCRYGVRSADTLERLPDEGPDTDAVAVPRRLVEKMTGPEQLAIPELRSQADLDIVSGILSRCPPLGTVEEWGVRFGRELNASDDRPHFVDPRRAGPGDLRVIEGKHVHPFRVDVDASRSAVPVASARVLLPSQPFARPRLAYRDVAASTNRLTLIAAVVPAGVVTTHTVFCLKPGLDEPLQQYLAAILNSYVANYLVRLRVTTHVTVAIVERLPVPVAGRDSPRFAELAALARNAGMGTADPSDHARLQALAAALYGVTRTELAHVLSTFPLVAPAERAATIDAFAALVDAI
jgi:hypothetical protein